MLLNRISLRYVRYVFFDIYCFLTLFFHRSLSLSLPLPFFIHGMAVWLMRFSVQSVYTHSHSTICVCCVCVLFFVHFSFEMFFYLLFIILFCVCSSSFVVVVGSRVVVVFVSFTWIFLLTTRKRYNRSVDEQCMNGRICQQEKRDEYKKKIKKDQTDEKFSNTQNYEHTKLRTKSVERP